MSSKPQIGDCLYLDRDKFAPITVIATMGDKAFYVPGHISIGSTNVGNLYATDNTRPYYK